MLGFLVTAFSSNDLLQEFFWYEGLILKSLHRQPGHHPRVIHPESELQPIFSEFVAPSSFQCHFHN
jgi:hypothetical protein